MADTINTNTNTNTVNKPKLQLRSGASFNDKAQSPSTKLMINHGKPNFTIQRSPKVQQNGDGNPLSPKPQQQQQQSNGTLNDNSIVSSSNNNNENAFKNANGNVNGDSKNDLVVKSTKFNGVFKPATLPLNDTNGSGENEAAKVILRRVKAFEPRLNELAGDDSVPEFIRKQRKIQERLAKDNILDFENRRSGYFTQVLISPSSPNRTSFTETMSSPAIVPSLEMPPPAVKEEPVPESQPEPVVAVAPAQAPAPVSVPEPEPVPVPVAVAVAVEPVAQLIDLSEEPAAAVATNGHIETTSEEEEVAKAIEEVNKAVAGEDDDKTPEDEVETEVLAAATKTVDEAVSEAAKTVEQTITTTSIEAQVEVVKHNGDTVTPSIPTPDPSGALGVNYESKTVVSFSKDLGSEPNKYPDTVKVSNNDEAAAAPVDDDLKELAKLKFDIKTDEQDVQVTPVLRAE